MKRLLQIPLIIIIAIFAGSSCKHNSLIDLTTHSVSDNCDPDTVYFQNTIYPMIISNCAMSGCHASGGGDEAKNLSNYDAIMTSGYVETFNANGSKLIEAVQTGGGESNMPPAPRAPLSSAQISSLKTWINQGARNNECTGGCDTTSVSYSGTIAPLMSNYCVGCHGSGASNTTGYNLASYNDSGSNLGVQSAATNGRLWGSVIHASGYSAMPKGGDMLPDCMIAEIRIWIENGYPND